MNQAMSLCPYAPDQSATHAHRALSLAIKSMQQAEHNAVLWFADILRGKLYRDLGYSSMNQYAMQELQFSKTRTGDFMQLTRRLDELPVVRQSIETGKIGYTKAREIVKVATPKTQQIWVDEAAQTTRRDLEKQVRRIRQQSKTRRNNPGQGDLLQSHQNESHRSTNQAARVVPHLETPEHLHITLTPEQFARYEALLEQWFKTTGHRDLDKAEMLLNGLAALTEKAPRGALHEAETPAPVHQLHIHHCPDCQQAKVTTSRGEKPLSPQDLDSIRCDARIHQPGKPSHNILPPKLRREVMTRDRHRCQAPGCSHTRFLEIHHRVPRSRGGSNNTENLVTLCSSCHRLHHRGHSTIAERKRGRSYSTSAPLSDHLNDQTWTLPAALQMASATLSRDTTSSTPPCSKASRGMP